MNLGDIASHANKLALKNEDNGLFDRILEGMRKNSSVRQAYTAFARLTEGKVKYRELALSNTLTLLEGIDRGEYSKFLESLDIKGYYETKINKAIHEAIISPIGSTAYNEALEFIVENMLNGEKEQECLECNEEYEALGEEERAFLEELALADEAKKRLMFDQLKEEALEKVEKAIEDSEDAHEFKSLKEARANIGRLKFSEENIIDLYEAARK